MDADSLTALVRKLKAENEALRRGKSSLENDLVAYEHKKELKDLRLINEELQAELQRIREEMDGLINQIDANSGHDRMFQDLKTEADEI